MQLGDFRILREIGRGGMGVVYEAEQASLGRRVALKVLPFAAVLDPRQLQRFKNEALAAACLIHQNIVPVYSVGCERGVHYYAMQYVEGESLAQVVRDLRRAEGLDDRASAHPSPENAEARPAAESRAVAETATKACDGTGRATPSFAARPTKNPEYFRRIARLGIQAAEALDHAHQHGILHRDIKPANLILDTTDNLWITDFGLARFESEASITITGDLVGTLRYMSPEQAQAKRVIVDHRTDIYSLGVTLYELLALEPAYAGSAREEILRQIAFDEPRRLRSRNRAIPAELEIIVLKAMEKLPEHRYGTAQEMADDLRRFMMDEPIRARRPTLTQRLRKWSRRHKSIAASVACIAAILLVAVTVVALVQRQAALSQSELAWWRLRVQAGINQALTEVARLRGATPTNGSTDQAAIAAAREQLQRAMAFVDSGVADPKQVARVGQLWIEFCHEQQDRQLLADLDRAWMAERGANTSVQAIPKRMLFPFCAGAGCVRCDGWARVCRGYSGHY